jgi:disulfide bond formation protein DsbB
MVIVLLVGAIRRDFRARYYALPLALIGLGISIYHYLLQRFPNLEATSSCDPSNPCSLILVNIFDFVSIPFMAGAGFIVIAVLLGFYVNKNSIEQEARVQ